MITNIRIHFSSQSSRLAVGKADGESGDLLVMRLNENSWQSRTGSCPTRCFVRGTIESWVSQNVRSTTCLRKRAVLPLRKVRWVKPEIRCEVACNEWDGQRRGAIRDWLSAREMDTRAGVD
jgi:hypothetical protein